jgi:prepilin-type N-terminal cleavage/methylation domain-containing protein
MNKGFSLVELSIVLVILGLLTGGILTGQSLIRAAELRSVTTEYSNYQTAAMMFRDKYFALPGDMRNATDFWGEMTNCGAASPSGTGTETCNGDGDGRLEPPAAALQTGEMYAFWQQLSNAGLIEGTYSGIVGSGGKDDSEIGENVPASKLGNSGWTANTLANYGGDTASYAADYRGHFRFGASEAASSTQGAILAPEEAWNIDKKLDDGNPGTGKVMARFWNNACATASSNTDYEAPYNLTDSSIQCALFFKDIF